MKYIVATFALALAGCGLPAKAPSSMTSAEVAEYNTPIDCDGAEECGLLWRRAQAWVVQNSGFKIQIATDAIVETYNPPTYSTRWAFRITRTPITKTRERIQVEPNCGEVPLCSRRKDSMVAAFNAYLRSAK